MRFVVCGGDGEWIHTGFGSVCVVVLVTVLLGLVVFLGPSLFVCLLACLHALKVQTDWLVPPKPSLGPPRNTKSIEGATRREGGGRIEIVCCIA